MQRDPDHLSDTWLSGDLCNATGPASLKVLTTQKSQTVSNHTPNWTTTITAVVCLLSVTLVHPLSHSVEIFRNIFAPHCSL